MKKSFRCPNCGADTTTNASVDEMSKMEKLEFERFLADLERKIIECGYVDCPEIVSRWKPSQTLRILHSRRNFGEFLAARGIQYQWHVLIEDLRVQKKAFEKKDVEAGSERASFFNKKLAEYLASDYICQLKDFVHGMPTRLCKKRPYVNLKVMFKGKIVNHGKGLFVDEFDEVLFNPLNKAFDAICNSKSLDATITAARTFALLVGNIPFNPPKVCSEYKNCFEGAGAYYTIKDLILFEGLSFYDKKGLKTLNHVEESLSALEARTLAVKAEGMEVSGYKLMGMLKQMLLKNNFDYQRTLEKWKDQSRIRRTARLLGKSRRPR